MIKHRYITIRMTKFFGGILVENISSVKPQVKDVDVIIIDLATGQVAVNAGVFSYIEVEGERRNVTVNDLIEVDKILAKRPITQHLPSFKGIEQTERAISALLDFKPCSSVDSDVCDTHLSLHGNCNGCPNNEAEKSK